MGKFILSFLIFLSIIFYIILEYIISNLINKKKYTGSFIQLIKKINFLLIMVSLIVLFASLSFKLKLIIFK